MVRVAVVVRVAEARDRRRVSGLRVLVGVGGGPGPAACGVQNASSVGTAVDVLAPYVRSGQFVRIDYARC